MNIKCPKCKKTVSWNDNPFRPFCSERCKTNDLGAWAAEEYRIESRREDESESENYDTED
ncbi:MAG: DNA gyrase inhibitor YacG [Nitrospira sp.]|nr:DNA gyrase inhibitor YacG [Nitrospira sp.]